MAVRNWSDQELLTSAAMNELTTSMNMRFANAAARDAFLVGDLAPVPGMTVCMLDTSLTLTYTVVGATGYWAPQVQALCFSARQAATQAMTANTFAAITNYTLAGLGNRNFGNWLDLASGKFTPQVPGLYEFTGGLGMDTGSAGSTFSHRGGFRKNGTGNTTYATQSENRQVVKLAANAVSFGLRKFAFAMNGTTDFVELVAWVPNLTNTSTGGLVPSFAAKYLGQ